jgi:3-oxoadipate enol-lactonase/4-carboxymuconolactone decarboxylase
MDVTLNEPRHYQIQGTKGAPVLVLLNSLGTTSAMWAPQIKHLSGWFTIITVEHLGHLEDPTQKTLATQSGDSSVDDYADDVIAVLDAEGIDIFSVCGISLGGMIALSIAERYPERVTHLILGCTAPTLPPSTAWAERAALVRDVGTGVLVDGLISRWFSAQFAADNPETVNVVASMVQEVTPQGYANACLAIAGCDLTSGLSSVQAETLVIAGGQDPVVSPRTALEYASALPGASFSVLAHSAHLANLSEPDRFSDLMITHLLGTASERGFKERQVHLGEDHVAASLRHASPIDRDFIKFLTETAWGNVWARPGLPASQRSMVTVAILAALGNEAELRLHLQAAKRNGVSNEELVEVLLHVALYSGIPTANDAIQILKRLQDPPQTG